MSILSLLALILEISPGNGKPAFDFTGIDRPPVTTKRNKGLNILLESEQLGSIKVSDTISYRQITISEIIGVDLISNSNGVRVYVNIYF